MVEKWMRTLVGVVVLGNCAVGTAAVERAAIVMQPVRATGGVKIAGSTLAQHRGAARCHFGLDFLKKRGFEECPQIAVDVIEHVNNCPAYRRRLDKSGRG